MLDRLFSPREVPTERKAQSGSGDAVNVYRFRCEMTKKAAFQGGWKAADAERGSPRLSEREDLGSNN